MDRQARQLVLQAAFAAVNHRLKAHIESLIDVLPELVDDEEDRLLCRALMLLGLEKHSDALALLSGRTDTAACNIRALVEEERDLAARSFRESGLEAYVPKLL